MQPLVGKRLVAFTALVLLVLALPGCIIVKDIRSAWHDAKVDPALVGDWITTKANPHHKTPAGFHITRDPQHHLMVVQTYVFNDRGQLKLSSTQDARTLTLGQATFIILLSTDRKIHDANASVIRYAVDDKSLTAYSLKPAVVKRAIAAGDLDAKLINDKIPEFPSLDKKNLAWLAKTAGNAHAWNTDQVYRRVKNINTASPGR